MSNPPFDQVMFQPGYMGISGDLRGPQVPDMVPTGPTVFRDTPREPAKRGLNDLIQFGQRPQRGDGGPIKRLRLDQGYTPSASDIITNTIGFPSQAKIVYHSIVGFFSDEVTFPPQLFQIIFVKKAHTESRTRRGYGRDGLEKDHFWKEERTIVNVPTLNWLMHLRSTNLHLNGQPDVTTAQDFLKQWTFLGVVVSERGNQGFSSQYDIRMTQGRLLNYCIKGKTETFNTFGSRVAPLTRLFAVARREDKSDGRTYKLEGNGNLNKKIQPIVGDSSPVCPWTIKFFADYRCSAPPESFLTYYDETGKRCRGAYFMIGYADFGNMNEESGLGTPTENEYDVQKIIGQRKIDIHVNATCPVF
jgi:hypothetical protein